MDNQENFVSPALNVLADKLGTTLTDLISTQKINYREKLALLLFAGHEFVAPGDIVPSAKEKARLKLAYIARISKVSQGRLREICQLMEEEGF